MKKVLSIVIIVFALTLALASCGGQDKITTTTTTQPPVHIHNYAEWEIIQEPTCTENGEKVRYCACGEKQSEVVVAFGHNPAEAIEENRVEATCYAEGSYDNVVYCSTCKAELERATHTLSKVEHTPANAVEENRVNPTHEKDGSYQMVVYCSVAECHAELERTTHTLDMLVHHPGNAVVENEVAATCTQNGSYDEVVYCLDDDCGHKELSRKTISVPMIAHTPAEAIEENRVEATCTQNGKYDEVIYCVNCRVQMSRTTKTIDATGHTEVIDPAVEATCIETGLTEGKHCSVCDEVLIAQNVVAIKEHTESDWIVDVEATTTTEGSKHTECTVCGATIKTETISKLPKPASEGLKFTLNSDKKSYSVTGIGTCTDTDIVIPETYEGLPVTSIGIFAFSGCSSLTSIEIPDSVTSIGNGAFRNCSSLESIEIPDSVTSIGEGAFNGCSALKSITLPFVGGSTSETGSSTSTVLGYIFGTSSYTGGIAIEQYYSILTYSPLAYRTCVYYIPTSLESVTITGGVIHLGAFSNCTGLTSVTLGDSVTSIGRSAFYHCSSLTSIEIPDSVTSIGSYAFYLCSSLTSIEIPDSVTSIGDYAFDGCSSLTNIEIPESVTSIGEWAFFNCKLLTSIVIPDSVTSIGEWAFFGCSSLTIYCEAEEQPSGWDSLWNLSSRPVVWGYKGE